MFRQQENKNLFIQALEECRIITYLVVAFNGMLVTFVKPFHYTCDSGKARCAFCGMRTAIYYLLHGKVFMAFQSNHLILVLLILGIFMIMDSFGIVFRRLKKR